MSRVSTTPGSMQTVVTARKRRRCDGHLTSERHWIEPGERCVASALPPDNPEVGNIGWWHAWFCMDCCPVEYTETVSDRG